MANFLEGRVISEVDIPRRILRNTLYAISENKLPLSFNEVVTNKDKIVGISTECVWSADKLTPIKISILFVPEAIGKKLNADAWILVKDRTIVIPCIPVDPISEVGLESTGDFFEDMYTATILMSISSLMTPTLDSFTDPDTYEMIESAFIHEYAHFKDQMTFKGPVKKLNPMYRKISDAVGTEEYYKSDSEINAFTNQVLQELRDLPVHDMDFNEFLTIAANSMKRKNKGVIEDDKLRKAFVKNVYSTWSQLLDAPESTGDETFSPED